MKSKILIVEDNPQMRQMIRDVVTDLSAALRTPRIVPQPAKVVAAGDAGHVLRDGGR